MTSDWCILSLQLVGKVVVKFSGGRNRQGILLACTVLQVVYPATSYRALSDSFSPSNQEAHAGAMRQATALLRWADKFGAAKLMKRAEHFVCKRASLVITVRALHASNLIGIGTGYIRSYVLARADTRSCLG
jgi:hypothetical protein